MSLSSFSTGSTFKPRSGLILIIGVAVLLGLVYQPLPGGFQQPWKYRFICFGSDFLAFFGRILEATNLMHRLNVTRMAYHLTIGTFNIRDPIDQIQVIDENVEHVSIRIYRPLNNSELAGDRLVPTVIFYHGGGYFLGSADVIEPITYLLAKKTNFQVIYIEFRLIPEHKYPAALSDCLLATRHLITNYHKYSLDLNNLILMGDSAGGNLATVVSQKLSLEDQIQPKLQVLIYPILQFFDFTLPSYRLNLPKRILGNIDHENFKNFLHYFTGIQVDDSVFSNGHTSQQQKESVFAEYVNSDYLPAHFKKNNLSDVSVLNDTHGKYQRFAEILLNNDVSPLLNDDAYLKKHTPPNTILVTVELDILRDDGFIFANRLKKLGLKVEHKHYENLFHGVLGLLHGPLEFRAAHTLLESISSSVTRIISK